jgi:tRNA dimethylallyltransferase
MPISYPPRLDAWYLTGPTASGKTAVALELAARIDAEILSLDSMAVYRGMDIGTAKPRAESPRHHLLDLVEPSDDFNLADFVAIAHRTIDEIQARGKTALFVGGTPLYLKALLRGLFVGPEPDCALRGELLHRAQKLGGQALHDRLAKIDPAAAARLHPHDVRRIIRAIEVFERTGRPITEHQKQFDIARAATDARVVVLDWLRSELYARIDRRVDEMFTAGWVEEVRRLETTAGGLGRTSSQAVGYREIIDHLAGNTDLPATIHLVKTRTRQFAKRQLTWFRSLSECRWLPMRAEEPPAETAQRIVVTVCGNTV